MWPWQHFKEFSRQKYHRRPHIAQGGLVFLELNMTLDSSVSSSCMLGLKVYGPSPALMKYFNKTTENKVSSSENKVSCLVTDLIWTLCHCYITSVLQVRLMRSPTLCKRESHSSHLPCYLVCTGHNLASRLGLSLWNLLHCFLISCMESTARERKSKVKWTKGKEEWKEALWT